MDAEIARLVELLTTAAPVVGTAVADGPVDGGDPLVDLVAEAVDLPGGTLDLLRPRNPDALAFDRVAGGADGADEEWHPPHWARLWPSAVALAGVLDVEDLGGMRVLELGCGLALPSLVAARSGARVTATDLSPAAVALAAVNAERLGLCADVAVGDWAAPDALVTGAPWDLVLAADVLYGHRAEALLRDLLPVLAGDRGTVLLADPGREPAGRFVGAAAGWHVDSRDVGAGISVHTLRLPGR